MKKQLVSMAFAAVIGIASVKAQGGFQRQTPEERTKAVMEKLAEFKMSKENTDKVDSVFLHYFSSQQKSMEEMRSSGNMDRESFMAKRKELNDARDAQLKLLFTPDQMKKWKDEIEPSMRPQRPGGGQ
jgi:periplasmic protein CpxP/Spy